jgi:hypothetical protein
MVRMQSSRMIPCNVLIVLDEMQRKGNDDSMESGCINPNTYRVSCVGMIRPMLSCSGEDDAREEAMSACQTTNAGCASEAFRFDEAATKKIPTIAGAIRFALEGGFSPSEIDYMLDLPEGSAAEARRVRRMACAA